MSAFILILVAVAVLAAVWPELFSNHIAHDLGLARGVAKRR